MLMNPSKRSGASADGSDALPVDAHELGDHTVVAMHAEPCGLLLEGIGETRRMVRPRYARHDDAMFGTVHTQGRIFDEGHGRPEVNCPPVSGRWQAVVDWRLSAAVGATA